MSFKEEVVIITGGAAGIGLAAARAFAVQGAHVLITGRRASRLEEISRVEERIEHLVADVGNPVDAQRTIARAIDLWGRVDVLVNNAGAGLPMPDAGGITAPSCGCAGRYITALLSELESSMPRSM